MCAVAAAEPRVSGGTDPRAALLMLAVSAAALLLLPADARLLAPAAVIGIAAWSGGQGRTLLRRLRLLLPMLLTFSLFIALQTAEGETLYSVGGITLTRGGIQEGAELGARLLLLAAAALLFVLHVPLQHFAAALAALRLPHRVIAVLWLTERVLVLLGDDFRRMLDCLRARAGSLSRLTRLRAAARIGGTFLLRAVGRSERLADAMSARAFRGYIPVLRTPHWQRRDTALCAATTVFFVLLWVL